MDMAKNDDYKTKFFESFSERVNDKVECIEMINIQADDETFKKMGLIPQPGTDVLWGLLVSCEKGLFFYVHPSETIMMAMLRVASHDEGPKEQFFDFKNVVNLEVHQKEKKWYDFLFNDSKFVLDGSFEIEGRKHICRINTQRKAADVKKIFDKYISQ